MYSVMVLIAAAALGADPEYAWQQTDHSLALIQGDKVVWQLNYKKEEGKPYFHPLTAAGQTLTDLRPADHYWHRALWFSWKSINGVLYWDEDPKTGKSPGETGVVQVLAAAAADHSAKVEIALAYHPPGQPPVLTEKRTLSVSPPEANGTYTIDWTSTFTACENDVKLDRTPIEGEPNGVGWGGYAGLSLRLVPALKKWEFFDAQGVVKEKAKDARWIAFSGPLPGGAAGSIVVFDHPANLRHPTPWYLIQNMPYFSPAVIYRAPYTLPAKESMVLRYRIVVQSMAVDRVAAEGKWKEFAGGK